MSGIVSFFEWSTRANNNLRLGIEVSCGRPLHMLLEAMHKLNDSFLVGHEFFDLFLHTV